MAVEMWDSLRQWIAGVCSEVGWLIVVDSRSILRCGIAESSG